jgi:hypothetical protein
MIQMLTGAWCVAWCGAAVDAIVETIFTPGSAIRAFGRSIALTGPRVEAATVALLGVSVGVIAAIGAIWVVDTLRAASLRKELERRDEQRSLAEAGLAAKNDLLSWRVEELQRQADELLTKRDVLVDELSGVTASTNELRTKAVRGKELLSRLTEELVVVPEPKPLEDPS